MRIANLNQAATSSSKPEEVIEAVHNYLISGNQQNENRGLSDEARAVSLLLNARIALAELFKYDNPAYITFTSGVTESINMVLGGLLTEGDHVITTSVEHNAVARPLVHLMKERKIEITWLQCAPDGSLDPGVIRKAVKKIRNSWS